MKRIFLLLILVTAKITYGFPVSITPVLNVAPGDITYDTVFGPNSTGIVMDEGEFTLEIEDNATVGEILNPMAAAFIIRGLALRIGFTLTDDGSESSFVVLIDPHTAPWNQDNELDKVMVDKLSELYYQSHQENIFPISFADIEILLIV